MSIGLISFGIWYTGIYSKFLIWLAAEKTLGDSTLKSNQVSFDNQKILDNNVQLLNRKFLV